MVKDSLQLDAVFHSLANPTRRDILSRISQRELSVGELVEKYNISFVAVSKHLKVLENAQLIRKRKEGRKYIVGIETDTLRAADLYLEQYRQRWQSRYEKLNSLLKKESHNDSDESN